MNDVINIIEDSFRDYAGAVLQSRALVDVRDMCKPSARQIFYCMYTDKMIHGKPIQKTLKAIGSATRMYLHGDSSALGIIMRAGQPFAFRYPLVEVEGSFGNLIESGNYASPRYTASRLSALAAYLFQDIEKETIEEWEDNYDETEKYPRVLPSKGFYNIVNGTLGIGVGAASSIPAFNLKEVNEALIKLLWNKDLDFEDIYCAPDFPTGALLLNEAEVKESLQYGGGKSCKLRSVIEFDKKERAFLVTEIPYGVYTNTICRQIEGLMEEESSGIERFIDLTGATPFIKIFVKKNANPDRVLFNLLKETSLQHYYGINMVMLKEGKTPKVFSWKEALLEFLTHQHIVYKRSFEHDLKKVLARLHIVEGIIIAILHIEDVVQIIKNSSTTSAAEKTLQKTFGLSPLQTKAILDIRLARLANLERNKFEKEKEILLTEKDRLEKILQNDSLLKKEIEKDLREVAQKFGDERRTKILNTETEESEPLEKRSFTISLTNKNNVLIQEQSSLYTQSRGRRGKKLPLDTGEIVLSSGTGETLGRFLAFSNLGNYYSFTEEALPAQEKISLKNVLTLQPNENIILLTSYDFKNEKKYVIFGTEKGKVKKSSIDLYRTQRDNLAGVKAIVLDKDDKLINVGFVNEEKIGLLSSGGRLLLSESSSLRETGRLSKGNRGIDLPGDDKVISFKVLPNDTKTIATIRATGQLKQTPLEDFSFGNLGAMGQKIVGTGSALVDFVAVKNDENFIITTSNSMSKIKNKNIPISGKTTMGVKTVNLKEDEQILEILTELVEI